jgi:hypothetical protein
MTKTYQSQIDEQYQLLQTLYKYYPIGVNRLNEYYLGFKELERIAAEKFQAACDETLEPWLTMMSEMRKASKFDVVDNTGNMTPCLNVFFVLKDNEYEYLAFNVFISLLGSFYTTYYIFQKRFKKGLDVTHLGFTLYKNHSYLLENEPNIDIEVDNIIQKYYPNYFHVKHDSLINYYPVYHSNPYYIKGVPHTQISTPLYNFFFDMIDLEKSIIFE